MLLHFCKPDLLRYYLRSNFKDDEPRFELWAIEGTSFGESELAKEDRSFLRLTWSQFVDVHDNLGINDVILSNIDFTSQCLYSFADVAMLKW